MAEVSLKVRKQELVRDAIFDAAIDLFARNGFNETTIDQIVEAAGISQRSFFRYFATKADLLAYNIAAYGDALVSALNACPLELNHFDVIRQVAIAGLQFGESEPRTQQIIAISAQNIAARQAQRAAMVEVENRISEAYAARTKSPSRYNLEPRMLTVLTLLLVDLSQTSVFTGEARDVHPALKTVLSRLTRMFCEAESSSPMSDANGRQRKRAGTASRQLAAR